MKDVIWTLIVVWLIYKLVEMVQHSARSSDKQQSRFSSGRQETPKEKPRPRDEGEYVDFEELQ